MKTRGFWRGKKVVITAGPTREYLDPVRYITNASSGRMGHALAATAYGANARVVLISGPVSLKAPRGPRQVSVVSATQMEKMALRESRDADVFIAAAAVSDWRPRQTSTKKLKKSGRARLTLDLVPNTDIVRAVAARRRGGKPFLLGFALETENLLANARKKLREKNLDAIVANPASAIDRLATRAVYINKSGRTASFKGSKENLARKILGWIEEDLHD